MALFYVVLNAIQPPLCVYTPGIAGVVRLVSLRVYRAVNPDGWTSASSLSCKRKECLTPPLERRRSGHQPFCRPCWLRGTVVERRSVTDELSLSYARPAADG